MVIITKMLGLGWTGLEALDDAGAAAIGILHELNAVADEHTNTVHSHLPCEIRENDGVGPVDLNTEERVR